MTGECLGEERRFAERSSGRRYHWCDGPVPDALPRGHAHGAIDRRSGSRSGASGGGCHRCCPQIENHSRRGCRSKSRAAATVLLSAGCEQLLFKYCSTFDSTDQGNIGPVAEVLQDLTGNRLTIACPSFPAAGRTVYKGHLFVGDRLLSESPLKDHPLTPMHDPISSGYCSVRQTGRWGLPIGQ